MGRVSVAGHVKRARQFFRHAQRKGYIDASPFSDIKAGSQANDERKYFVDRATIDRVIEAAPNAEWRLLIALARYGGLRNPSERLRLKWEDIHWGEGRITVMSKKTKKHNPTRSIPLFPELEPFLVEASEQAEEGAIYCIERYRSQDVNLRTGLERILKKAHLEPWPRLWHNLRASRETELANDYPIHVAAEWLGNSPAIAAKHYLTVTNDHYAQAIEKVGQGVGQQVGQQVPESTDDTGKEPQRKPCKTRGKAKRATFAEDTKVALARPIGVEHPGKSPGNKPIFKKVVQGVVPPTANHQLSATYRRT